VAHRVLIVCRNEQQLCLNEQQHKTKQNRHIIQQKTNTHTGQSYAFFYQAWKVLDQSTPVTRVASGCPDDAASSAMQAAFRSQILQSMPGSNFHLHLTPDYSKTVLPGVNYKFFNKPHGLHHWMKEGLGFPNTLEQHRDTIFVILDPDQFILRPFQVDYRDDPTAAWHPPSIEHGPPLFIEEGRPFAQLYGFGGTFVKKLQSNATHIVAAALNANSSSSSAINPTNPSSSMLHRWTAQDAASYYAAGPPYIAVATDMWKIVSTWAAVVGPVYEVTREHLSEMFAYSAAAAHLNLKHVLSYSFMVSDPTMGRKEGFEAWIDAAPSSDMCKTEHDSAAVAQMPQILHYCQRYFLGPYFFSKYKLPKNFLDCDQPLLVDPVTAENTTDIAPRYDSSVTPNGENNPLPDMLMRKRHMFFICQMIHKMNAAATYFKQQHCGGNANYSKVWHFHLGE
jgi:peptidyl serine alpha-galactosyltransferase